MILDLTDIDIMYEDDFNNGNNDNQPRTNETAIHHLTQEVWVVVLTAVSPKASDNNDLTDSHFDSSIITRVKLHDDKDVWMLPLSTLLGPCYTVYNKDYISSTEEQIIDDRTTYVVKPMCDWADEFLPPTS